MAVHHKLPVPLPAERIRVGRHLNGPGPCLVGPAEAPVPFLLLDRVGQHIEHPVIAKLLRHLADGSSIQPVVPVVFGDCRFNGLLAGDVGPLGGAVLVQLPMLTGVGGGVLIDGQFPLGIQGGIGTALDAVPDDIHVSGLALFKFPVGIGQRGRRRQ